MASASLICGSHPQLVDDVIPVLQHQISPVHPDRLVRFVLPVQLREPTPPDITRWAGVRTRRIIPSLGFKRKMGRVDCAMLTSGLVDSSRTAGPEHRRPAQAARGGTEVQRHEDPLVAQQEKPRPAPSPGTSAASPVRLVPCGRCAAS